MSYTGRVNVDVLIHDKGDTSFRLIDVESSRNVSTKSVLLTGTLTETGVAVSPQIGTGIYDSDGDEIIFTTMDYIIGKATSAMTINVTGVSVVVKAEANQCCATATTGSTSSIVLKGTGTYQLVVIGT